MKKLLVAFAAASLLFATGCGKVCDDAADICGGGDAEGGEEVECEGAAECAAQCIVDEDSCTSEAVVECILGCA